MIIKSLKDNKSKMPYFINKDSEDSKKKDYEKTIVRILSNNPLSLTELAKEMGYKGITKKLSDTVNTLYNNDVLRKEVYDNSIKYVVNVW